MFLSIIIPTYNCEKYIGECISSIIKEVDNDVEIIIVDDGSTDNTKKIIDYYIDEKIIYCKNNNHGVSYSRNFGIDKAKGEYIMFVDADDVLSCNWYQAIKKVKNKKYDIIYFSGFINTDSINKLEIIDNIIGYPSKNTLGNLSSPCSKLYKRLFLINNDIKFEEAIINGEDLLFNLKSALLTENITFIKHSIYKYRINQESSTHKFNDFIFESNSIFIMKMCQYFQDFIDYPIKQYYKFCMFNSIYIFLYRISLIKDRKIIRSKYYIFKTGEYSIFLNEYNFEVKYGLLKNIFIYLIKYKLIDLAILVMKIKIIFQNFKIKSEQWEEI